MEIEDAGNLFMCIRAELPSDLPIEAVNEKQLPQDWYTTPAPKSLALIGDDWFASRRTTVLKVPSAIIRVEFNYLLNPLHADFSRINIQAAEPFVLDRRLWK